MIGMGTGSLCQILTWRTCRMGSERPTNGLYALDVKRGC